jgi:hypothetical protein
MIALLTSCSSKTSQWETHKLSANNAIVSEPFYDYARTIKDLNKYSNLIISGEVIKKYDAELRRITNDPNVSDPFFVFTTYDIKIDKAVKGRFKTGDIVTIKVEGGAFEEKNYIFGDLEQLYVGQKSIFFLRDFVGNPVAPNDEPPSLINDLQGVIQLKNNKVVTKPGNNLFEDKNGQDKDKFLNDLSNQLK